MGVCKKPKTTKKGSGKSIAATIGNAMNKKKKYAEKLAGDVDNPAYYFYTVCKGDYDQCEPKFVRREAGQEKEVCMISAKVQKGKEPEWVKYRKTN